MILSSIIMNLLVILTLVTAVAAPCPDGCGLHDDISCCELGPKKFACCPYGNGVCCTDGKHCCPQGSKCDDQALNCNYPNGLLWPYGTLFAPHTKTKDKSAAEKSKSAYIICPDRKSICSSGSRCCRMADDKWGCCPHANGVCCLDGGHCCPFGSQCNAADGTCIEGVNPWLSVLGGMPRMQPSRSKLDTVGAQQPHDMMAYPEQACDDSKSFSCPKHTTCCSGKTGDWACCPMQNAVCCSDGIHCCPKDTVCDLKTESCVPSSSAPSPLSISLDHQPRELQRLQLATSLTKVANQQLCPDGKSECPSHYTCCRLADFKSYGCCPLDQATCCSDGKNCCPKGYKCNLEDGTCVRDNSDPLSSIITPSDIHPASASEQDVKSVCPGGLVSCPSGTCYVTSQGHYRCCPYVGGVYCPDSDRCCPANSMCDPYSGNCLPMDDHLFDQILTSKMEMKPFKSGRSTNSQPTTVIFGDKKTEVTICSGQDFYCPNASTCCPGGKTKWLCCPHPNAVCCDDQSHCCPPNTVCSATHQGCLPTSSDDHVPNPPTPPTVAVSLDPKDKFCPDKKSVCGDDMPCCQLVDKDWGCCPLSKGVCCAGLDQCCPPNTRCTDEGYCEAYEGSPLVFTAPYLIPKKQYGKRIKAAVHDVEPVVYKFPLAKTASPALRDLMLLSPVYRRMKELYHVICPSGVHKCLRHEKCCPSDKHGYTCIPITSECCSPASGTYCPSGKTCSLQGTSCTRG